MVWKAPPCVLSAERWVRGKKALELAVAIELTVTPENYNKSQSLEKIDQRGTCQDMGFAQSGE